LVISIVVTARLSPSDRQPKILHTILHTAHGTRRHAMARARSLGAKAVDVGCNLRREDAHAALAHMRTATAAVALASARTACAPAEKGVDLATRNHRSRPQASATTLGDSEERMRNPPDELHEFLSAFAVGISKLFLATRRVVLTAAPEANELIYNAYNAVTAAYSFSGRLKEAFCHVAAYSNYVNLGFNRGAELSDPAGLLVGSGARIRHIRIANPNDLRAPALQSLLGAAVRQGRLLVAELPSSPVSAIRPTTGAKRRPRVRGS
jgi:hypothetical protein